MSKKSGLLSIGELAKITGASIKSLRYYDKMGILQPTYVSPDSGYRYYSTTQRHTVEVIQICIGLSIPLKDILSFINDQTVELSHLLDYGKKIAKRKIQSIQQDLDFIHHAQEEISRSEKYEHIETSYTREVPDKFFYLVPYNHRDDEMVYLMELNKAFQQLYEKNIEVLFECGMLHEYTPDEIKRYIFIEVHPDSMIDHCITKIPGGTYKCRQLPQGQIEKAPELFQELLNKNKHTFIIEAEMTTSDLQNNQQKSELRMMIK